MKTSIPLKGSVFKVQKSAGTPKSKSSPNKQLEIKSNSSIVGNNLLSEGEIKQTFQNIRSSPKYFNDIIILIQNLETLYQKFTDIKTQSQQKRIVEKFETQTRLLIISLLKIFENLIQTNVLRKSVKKETNDKKIMLNKWLKARYESFQQQLLQFIKNFNLDHEILIDSLDTYLKLMKIESQHWAPKNEKELFFPIQLYEPLVNALIFESQNGDVLGDGTNSSILVEFFNTNYLNSFKDLKFYFLSLMFNALEQKKKDGITQKTELFFSKWLTIMKEDFFHSIFHGNDSVETLSKTDNAKKVNDDDDEDEFGFDDDSGEDDSDEENVPSDSEEFELNDTFVPNPPVSVQKYASYKSLFTKNWISILSFPGILTSQLKTTLLVLHKRIIPYMIKPERLMDFLTQCYDSNDALIVQILALNGLFQLMLKNNLEYPSFYEKLYQFFHNPEILTNRYRSRFFRLVDLFLSSTHLPAAIVASFIKRMARLSIFSNPGGIVIVLPFVYNLLKRHPSCMILIHNPLLSQEELNDYSDPFNNEETNPLLTNALESSLWELETLSTHYHPNVATLAKIFSNPFTKVSYNIEDFLDWNYKNLVQSEKTRRIKNESMMALEFESWDNVFSTIYPNDAAGEDEVPEKSTYLEGWAF